MTISSDLASALNETVINEAFKLVIKNRPSLLSVVGFGGARAATEGYKMSWLDMAVAADQVTVNGAVLIDGTSIVTAAGSVVMRPGMLLSVDASDEVMLVTAVAGTTSAYTLTVTRGVAGTAAAISDGATLTIDSIGREENSTGNDDGIYQPDVVENYFQTIDTMITMSRRALSTMQYGNTNSIAFQIQERIRQLAIKLDRMLIRGPKLSTTVGGDAVTYSGGLRYWAGQTGRINTDASAATLTLDMIAALDKEVVSRGGVTDTLVVGIAKAQKLASLIAANYSSQRLSDWSSDRGAITVLPSDIPLVGSVNKIVVDTNVADDELFVLDSSMVKILPMAALNAENSGSWTTKNATTPGQDGQSVRVLGDFAVEMMNSKTHFARLYNIG